jgi:hypothetical protein
MTGQICKAAAHTLWQQKGMAVKLQTPEKLPGLGVYLQAAGMIKELLRELQNTSSELCSWCYRQHLTQCVLFLLVAC